MNIEKLIYSESRKLSEFYYPYYIENRKIEVEDEETELRIKNKIYFHYKQYWEKIARMFCVRESYNAEKLIIAALMDGFKYPQQIAVEYTWELYKQYLPGIKDKKTIEIENIEEIVKSVLEVKRIGSVKDWININKTKIINNFISVSPMLLSFSRTFIIFCEENCPEVYDFDKFKNKVYNLKNCDKVLEKIEKFLGNDYIGG